MYKFQWQLIIIIGVVTLFAGCEPKGTERVLTDQDAYIWQRTWTTPLKAAIHETEPFVRAWRVLGGELNEDGQLSIVNVDLSTLRGTGKPIILVVRIARSNRRSSKERLARQISSIALNWRTTSVSFAGIEIDYDCPTKDLSDYRELLSVLRKEFRYQTNLSITALPSWLESPNLPSLLAEANESVLQVHSIQSRKKGLFDSDEARKWVAKWALQSPKPFRVALPSYWSRVAWNSAGEVSTVESEIPRYGPSDGSRELLVMPQAVESFLLSLQHHRIRNLAGVVWLRLPTSDDRRAWSLQTFHAVMQGKPLGAEHPSTVLRRSLNGALDLWIINDTDTDGRLPGRVEVMDGSGCEVGDALPPYEYERRGLKLIYTLKDPQMIDAGRERIIGWVRCSAGEATARAIF